MEEFLDDIRLDSHVASSIKLLATPSLGFVVTLFLRAKSKQEMNMTILNLFAKKLK